MIPLNQIDKEVRAKVAEAVPDVEFTRIILDENGSSIGYAREWRHITLPDILIAISAKDHVTIDSDGCFRKSFGTFLAEWDLTEPYYTKQKEETKRFIHSVICK